MNLKNLAHPFDQKIEFLISSPNFPQPISTKAGPSTRSIRQLPKAPKWKGGPKILEKKG